MSDSHDLDAAAVEVESLWRTYGNSRSCSPAFFTQVAALLVKERHQARCRNEALTDRLSVALERMAQAERELVEAQREIKMLKDKLIFLATNCM